MRAGLGVVMSGKGPPPKSRRSRSRDEKPITALPVGPAGPPALPDEDYLPQTVTWWTTWASSEQAHHFTATSWQRLAMLLPLVDAYFREPTKELMGEIRLNESKLGATPEDLMRLRWKVEPPASTAPKKSRYDHISVEDL